MLKGVSFSRRRFLGFGSATGIAALLAACGGSSPTVSTPVVPPTAIVAQPTAAPRPAQPAPTAAAQSTTAAPAQPTANSSAALPIPSQFQESPMLADLVKQGKLPPVKDRLPDEPMVINRKGKYGGTLRTVNAGESIFPFPPRYAGGMQGTPLRIAPDLKSYVPNLAKSVQYSEDYKSLTVSLRKGLKWSDGQPYTADDWQFWYEDVLNNKELTPAPNPWFTVGGSMMKFVKIDDYTFRFDFAAPNPAFALVNFAHIIAFPYDNALPAHYLKQFHIKYNPKATEQAKAAGFESWFQWFTSKRDDQQNPDVPRTGGYIVEKVTPGTIYYTRNPYYWMIDSEGKQLPYIDKIVMDRLPSMDPIEARAVAGNYDFVDRGLTVKNFKTYKDGEQKGGYVVRNFKTGLGAAFLYDWNLNYPDKVWNAVFNDVRFRRAMSLAINRKEINDVLYFGFGTPAQMTAHPTTRAYKEEYANAWAQYDPDMANKLLDEMGLKWSPDKTVRLLPDGRPMKISFEIWQPDPIHELTVGYWKKIGVQVDYKTVLRSVLLPKIQANQVMMQTWNGDEVQEILLLRRPKWFTPGNGDEQTISPLWGQWYATNGKQGQEPPPEIKQLYDWMDKYEQTNDVQYADKILAYQADNLLVVGTVRDNPIPLIFNKDLKNVPETGYWGWDSLSGYAYYAEGWYFNR